MNLKIEHFCEIEEKFAFNLKYSFRITLKNIEIIIFSRALVFFLEIKKKINPLSYEISNIYC